MPESDVFRTPRPWVQLAAFCQLAMQETNGALSVIRITDRVAVSGTTPQMQPTNIQWTLVVILKSDQMKGQYTIKLKIVSPSGQVTEGLGLPGLFEGDDRGVQLILPGGMMAAEQGLFWFEIYIEDDLLTRIPLRVLYQRIQLPPGAVAFPGIPPVNPGSQ